MRDRIEGLYRREMSVVRATRFTELAGCRVPVQQAPMGSVSTPTLAAAVAAAAARVRIVDFFWADPDPRLVEIAHRGGALACWQVGSLEEARAAEIIGSWCEAAGA